MANSPLRPLPDPPPSAATSPTGKRLRYDSGATADLIRLPPLILKPSLPGSFAPLRLKAIHSSLLASVGEIREFKMLPRGDVLVYPSSAFQEGAIRKMASLCSVPLVVVPPGCSRSRGPRGKLLGVPDDFTVDDVRGALEALGCAVVTVRRLGAASSTCFFELVSGDLPRFVLVCHVRFPVHAFVDRPLRCFRCSRFGHMAASCRFSARCKLCAGPHPVGDPCTAPVTCPNCSGPHSAVASVCPVLQRELAVLVCQKEGNLPFPEARAVVAASLRPSSSRVIPELAAQSGVRSFAEVTATPFSPRLAARLPPFRAPLLCYSEASTQTAPLADAALSDGPGQTVVPCEDNPALPPAEASLPRDLDKPALLRLLAFTSEALDRYRDVTCWAERCDRLAELAAAYFSVRLAPLEIFAVLVRDGSAASAPPLAS